MVVNEQDFVAVMKALERVLFECDGITQTKAPSKETYNKSCEVLIALRAKHNAGKVYGGPAGMRSIEEKRAGKHDGLKTLCNSTCEHHQTNTQYRCLLDAGHVGVHRNGDIFWA